MISRLGVTYQTTNESLDAIMAGLDVGSGDRVLAVGGSGDQAFAFAEKAAQVRVVDHSTPQLTYISGRIQALQEKDRENFLLYLPEELNNECEGKIVEIRDEYFSRKRLNRIRRNLEKIEIIGHRNVLRVSEEIYGGMNKIYLSNVLGRSFFRDQMGEIKEILLKISKQVPKDSLIYIADTDWIISSIMNPHSDDLPVELHTKALKSDRELTLKARRLEIEKNEGFWAPTVFRVVA